MFFVSVVPTFLRFDILGSEGKNVVYMTLVYLIGSYIRKYDDRTYHRGKMAVLLLGNILLVMVLETSLFTIAGRYSMFYRDCSIFTLISSLLLFTIFRNIHFESKAINKVAGSVLAVYVFSFGFLPLGEYAFSPLLFPLVAVFASCVVLGCIVVDQLRQKIFGKAETRLAEWLAGVLGHGLAIGKEIGMRFTDKLINYIMKR